MISYTLQYFLFLTLYLFTYSFLLRKLGGAELKELQKELKRSIEKARYDAKELARYNELMRRNFALTMKYNLYLFPLALLFLWVFKYYSHLFDLSIFGFKINILVATFIYLLFAGPIIEKIVDKIA